VSPSPKSPAPAEDAAPDAPASTSRSAPVKRTWQTPRVRTGHLFESNSLACGKNTPALDQCIQNPVSS
jgi:hypothetical protein